MDLVWLDFKSFLDTRGAPAQYLETAQAYWLKAFDGPFDVSCVLTKDEGSDQIDFETNYKATANQSPTSQVITQFEQKDKTLKLASFKQDVDGDGNVVILIKIPGTPGSGDGRFIAAGTAWFSQRHDDDRIMGVYFVDVEGLIAPSGTVVGSYTDDALDSSQQGWRIPPIGHVEAETLGFYGFAPAGFYIKIIAKSGNGAVEGKAFYVNMEWGVKG